ncbi:neutral zinc metallopeptidase [Herbidospora yilanensis]|uniref:neutral zinc metallopeptidase n=1 Tax=Herbidospora yilanensis TaxID=354426 RepID=UPI000782AE08|nr:neutral zinc metallopeptidase [Herbidospora yilanensis]
MRPAPAGPYGPPRQMPVHWQPRRKSSAGPIIGGILGLTAVGFVVVVLGASIGDRPAATEPVVSSLREGDRPVRDARRGERQPVREQRAPLNTSLKENTVYSAGALPRTRCPGGRANVFDHAQIKAHVLKTAKCMDRAWKTTLEKVGIPFEPPKWVIASGKGRGPCGDFPQANSAAPYYCPRTMSVYASTKAMANGNGESVGYARMSSWHGSYTAMMGHEYGHHVQQLTGLSQARWEQNLASGSESRRLALSRRLELQANCFAGMFMRSVAGSYPVPAARRDDLFAFWGSLGDHPGWPRDHGSPPNNGVWFRQGWQKQQAYQCNTWVMPSKAVS